jgi:hypothetical protein
MPYIPAAHTVSNKPYGVAQATPTDARSMYYDPSNFVYRPYQTVAEANTYLNLTKWRQGYFTLYMNLTGTLNGDGTFTGGTITEYWYKDGTADANLIKKTDGEGQTTADLTSRINDLFSSSDVNEVVLNTGDITVSGAIDGQGKKLVFKNGSKLVGTYSITDAVIVAGSHDYIFGGTATLTNMKTESIYVHAKWWGTVGDGTVDDHPACQAASDAVIANPKLPRTVKLIGGETYRHDNPWILYKWSGLNYNFFTCNIFGEDAAWFNGAAPYHARINVNNTTKFGIGVQLGRSSWIRGIEVIGQFNGKTFDPYNRTHYTRDYETYASEEGVRDTFHSPYCGIIIDPFINFDITPATGKYPGLESWYRGTISESEGNRTGSGSSGIRIKDCYVSGFTVDIGLSLNGTTQNAEDIHVEDCRLEVAKVAYASGDDQNKNNTINRCATWDRVHTLVDTRSYGKGTGLMPNIDGWNIASGSIMRIWNIDGLRFPATIKNVFAELLFRIGDGNGGAALAVESCEFGLNTFPPYFVPASHISGGDIKFTNCRIFYYDDSFDTPIIIYGTGYDFDHCILNMAPVLSNPLHERNSTTFRNCRTGQGLLGWERMDSMNFAGEGGIVAYGNVMMRRNTYNDSGGSRTTRGVKEMNYYFNCGSYLGTHDFASASYVVDDATRTMVISGLSAENFQYVSVGDYITDDDTNIFWGIVDSLNTGAGTATLRHVPVDIPGGAGSTTFYSQYVRRISGHFIGDVTNGSAQITNCEYDPTFPVIATGTRLSIGNASGRDVIVTGVSGSTVYISGNSDHTSTGLYFPPVETRYAKTECQVTMYYDPLAYTNESVPNAYPLMFPKGAKVYTEVAGGPQDYVTSGSEWLVTVPGFLQPSTISKTNQAEFIPIYDYAALAPVVTGSGLLSSKIRVVDNADITIAADDYTVVLKSSTTNKAVTIPVATSHTNRMIRIVNTGTSTITFSETIRLNASTTSTVFATNTAVDVQSDGTEWWLIGITAR